MTRTYIFSRYTKLQNVYRPFIRHRKEIITEDNQRLKLAEADLKNEVSKFNLPEDRVHYHAILDTPIDGILTTAEKYTLI